MSCGLLFMGGQRWSWFVGRSEVVVNRMESFSGDSSFCRCSLFIQSCIGEPYPWESYPRTITKVCLSGMLIYREICGRPSQTDLTNQQRFPNKKRGSISAWFPIGRAWHCMTTTLTKTLRCPNTGTMIDNLLSWHLWNQKITKHNMFAICNLGIIDELILTYKQSHIQDRS